MEAGMQDYGVREKDFGVREQGYDGGREQGYDGGGGRDFGGGEREYDGGREKVWFGSGGTECAGWHYRGANGGCVIMAGGFAVTKEPGTDLFAKRFHEAGFSVLAFDYRHLGESGGQPRQVV